METFILTKLEHKKSTFTIRLEMPSAVTEGMGWEGMGEKEEEVILFVQYCLTAAAEASIKKCWNIIWNFEKVSPKIVSVLWTELINCHQTKKLEKGVKGNGISFYQ